MKLNIILPKEPLPSELAKLMISRVLEYFGAKEFKAYGQPDCYPREVLNNLGIKRCDPFEELHAGEQGVVVYFVEPSGTEPHGTILWPALVNDHSSKQFYIDLKGRIHPYPRNGAITELQYSEISRHIFNTLGPRGPLGGFYYYPYGYLFRDGSVGTIDSLGFRIPNDLEFLIDRSPEHKLVIVFGGSAAFSMFSSKSEMFSSILEKNLNEFSELRGSSFKFTVLNFGMHGNVLINQINSYMLYCERFNPDIIISHDGWNDVVYGLMSDPHLLDKWNITYQYNLESWGQLIHGTHSLEVGQPRFPFSQRNLKFSLMRAYYYRKFQFKAMIENANGIFIWATQPSIYDKKGLSILEEKGTKFDPADAYAKIYPLTRAIMSDISSDLRDRSIDNYVDFPSVFNKYAEETTLFVDHVHTTPLGDEVIGRAYSSLIVNMIDAGKFDCKRAI